MDEFMAIIERLIQEFEASIDEFTDEEANEIATFIQDAVQFIHEQQQTAIPEKPLEAAPYPSSNINSFAYDPKSKRLLVKFMGKDVANAGPTYSYEGVPDFIVDVFARGAVGPKTTGKNKWHAWFKGVTPSHGAAMHALIKQAGFPYQRVA